MAHGTWGGTLDRHPFAVKISWSSGTNVQQTGFHLRSAGATTALASDIATDVAAWVNASFRMLLTTDQRVLGIDCVDLVTREGGSVSPASQFGGISYDLASSMPDYSAVVISAKGELRTRYGQGRMFWPLVSETYSARNSLNATGISEFTAVANALATKYIGNSVSGYNLINVHGVLPARAATPHRPARPEIPASWYDVQSLRLNQNTSFLRSRKAGVGS